MAILSKGPLAYTGVASANPPNFFSINRAPTEKDYKKFKIGDIWLQKETSNIWILSDIGNKTANWVDITADLVTYLTITPGDLTITDGDFYLKNGGFVYGAVSYPSILRTLSDGTVYGQLDGDDGEVLIGSTTGTPSWQSITSDGATVTITNSPNGINLEAAGGTAVNTYTLDDGNAIVPTAGGNIDLQGGNNITTSGAVASQALFDLDDDITLTSVTTTGNLTVGGNSALTGTLHVGGTTTLSALSAAGALTLNTTEGVLLSDGAGIISSLSGTNGYVLTSNGAGAVPTWQDSGGGAAGTIAELVSKVPAGYSMVNADNNNGISAILFNDARYDSSISGYYCSKIGSASRVLFKIFDDSYKAKTNIFPTATVLSIGGFYPGNGYLVLSSNSSANSGGNMYASTSNDGGVTWIHNSLAVTGTSGPVKYNDGTFVVSSGGGASIGDIWYSTAATYNVWTRKHLFNSAIRFVGYGNGYWITIGTDTAGGNSYIKYSATVDGVWNDGATLGASGAYEVEYLNGFWVTSSGRYIENATPTGAWSDSKACVASFADEYRRSIRVLNGILFTGLNRNTQNGYSTVYATNAPDKFWVSSRRVDYGSENSSTRALGMPLAYHDDIYFGNVNDIFASEAYGVTTSSNVISIGVAGF